MSRYDTLDALKHKRRTFEGSISVICGPMYAGKTTQLMKKARKHRYANKKVLVVKPSIDDRFGKSEAVSHDNIRMDAVSLNLLSDCFSMIDDFDVICIEEGQFFHDLTISSDLLANMGKHVIISMLNGTFERTKFPLSDSNNIFCIADDIIMLKAVCVECGNNAVYSKLKNETKHRDNGLIFGSIAIEKNPENDNQILQEEFTYIPLCRKCFFITKK